MDTGKDKPITNVDTELIAATTATCVAIKSPPRPLDSPRRFMALLHHTARHPHIDEGAFKIPDCVNQCAGPRHIPNGPVTEPLNWTLGNLLDLVHTTDHTINYSFN